MGTVSDLFAPLQALIAQHNLERDYCVSHPWYHQLSVYEENNLLDVEYHGESEIYFQPGPAVPILHDLLTLLARPDVACRLNSFTFRTPGAIAADGACDYDIDPLVDGEHSFPKLKRVFLDQGQGEHGYKILTSPSSGDHWNEAGVLARLLSKAPRLDALTSPVPPNEAFFRGPRHPLRVLDVDAAHKHADFIRRLAECTRFPELRRLTFTDYRWRTQTTRFEDFELFFQSPLAAQLESICLREVILTPDQIRRLRAIRSDSVEITQSTARN